METPKSQESLAKEGIHYNVDEKATPVAGSTKSSNSITEGEVFAAGEDGVNFRTVGWIRGMYLTPEIVCFTDVCIVAAMFFLKVTTRNM
jgi:hypothetical protein